MSRSGLHISPRLLKTALLSTLGIGLLASVLYQNWINTLIVSGIIVLSLLPELSAKHFSVTLPAEFDLATITFIFAAIFLGELGDFYERFWWWDELLHLTSGLLLGMLGLYLIWVLNHNERIDLELSPRFICLFSFTFALSVGTLWELFEYGMDNLFALNMQKSGLNDTMKDLMIDAVGALIISLSANAYLAKGRESFVSSWVKRVIYLSRKSHNQRKISTKSIRLRTK